MSAKPIRSSKILLYVLTRRRIVTTEIWSRVAAKAGLRFQVLAHAVVRISNKHTETRLESGDLCLPWRDIVHDEPTIRLPCILVVEEVSIGDLRYPLVGSILGFEV